MRRWIRKSESDPAAGGPRTALVFSGGGARAAYQVGVLQGMAALGLFQEERSAFDILVGASAGSINACTLAASAERPAEGIDRLARVWSELKPQQVFRTDLRSLGGIGMRWMRDLSLGGFMSGVAPKALLDTSPLRELLSDTVPFARIGQNIEKGLVHALAISATNLYTADGVVFVQGQPEIPLWTRSRWDIERTEINVDHLMASSAIPIFFPSIDVDGRHFGDGCIRNTAPLSPAINLGADRIVAIGVREAGRAPEPAGSAPRPPPTIAQIAGTLLDAVMLDAIEVDIEHSDRINRSIASCPTGDPHQPFRRIDVLWLTPSRHFNDIAAEHADRIPRILRYLMGGLGTDEETTELASYLLFDSKFCSRLIEIGRADVEAGREEIEEFFSSEPAPRASARER